MTQTKIVPKERCPACEHYEQIAKNTEARRAVAFELFHIYYKQTRAQDKGIKRLHRKINRLEKKLTASPAPQERRVGQRRTLNDLYIGASERNLIDRRAALNAAGQDSLNNNPKTLVEPVPAVPNYSSVPMGPVGATYPAAPEPTDHLDAPDSQERAAQTPCTDPACPDEKQYGSVHPAPGPVCDHDSKPCPPPKAGRGPGASQCEQHGVCQRVGFGNSPTLQFELMVPEDTYSNICINCGKSFLSIGKGKRHVTCPDCLKGESKLLLRAEVCESVRNEIRGAKLWPLSMWANIDELCDQALAAIDLGDELRDMRTIKDAAVRRLSVLGTRIDELENQAKYERQWKEQYYRQSEKLSNDNADLRHDIARHVQICAEQATEIEELKQRAGISILSPIGRT